jgi:uracil-DNA glycosylase
MTRLEAIYEDIKADPANRISSLAGYNPVYTASEKARIVIVGQAPGRKAQTSGIPWNDVSGDRLRAWLDVTNEQFYDSDLIALIPMDFYYPGKGVHGDLPPRDGFAAKWHPLILAELSNVELFLLIGRYAQQYYLENRAKKTLTETVRAYHDFLPGYFPIVHPSPLNFRWLTKNPWFITDLVPELRTEVHTILAAH